ncbi:uncharacterized protein LOC109801812 isoform X2 [Cajanus cajan]|uniref:uncharacterized protein LOC109801812 isoform X2 n=1 Tax=Cajanus cajan TaxID=3821 RepID=UPI00098DBC68|nr:uncharacterized protein LOC109801812 isoform X2 [Cajanus cajan]
MSAAFSATPSAAQVLSLFRSLLRVAREFPDYTSGNTPNAAPSMRFVKTPPSPTLLPFPPPSPVASLSSRSLNDRPSCTLSTPLRFAASWNSNNPPYSRGSEYDSVEQRTNWKCVFPYSAFAYRETLNDVKSF